MTEKHPARRGAVRPVIISAVVVWIVVAVTILVVDRFPEARATGHLERQGAAFQAYLQSGWYPMELNVLSDQPGHPPDLIASNWSDDAQSTLRVPGSWQGMRLFLASVTCPGGAPEVVSLASGPRTLPPLTVRPGWNWYSVSLRRVGVKPSAAGSLRTVLLRYSCTLRQAVGGIGLPGHLVAVAIGGLDRATEAG
jgi:hypothetical protein